MSIMVERLRDAPVAAESEDDPVPLRRPNLEEVVVEAPDPAVVMERLSPVTPDVAVLAVVRAGARPVYRASSYPYPGSS